MRRLILAFLLLAAACGGSDSSTTTSTTPGDSLEEAFAVVASSDLALGSERILVAVAGPNNQRLGAPDLEASLEAFPADAPDEVQSIPMSWVWAVPDVSGLYRGVVDFDRAGAWTTRLTIGGNVLSDTLVVVTDLPATVAVGSAAPASVTPTAADVTDLAEITTDPDPEPELYDLSVSDAISNGRPTVVVFSTPAFCQTAICGPTLDVVKEAAAVISGVDFVHVEVYEGMTEPGFVPDPAHLSPAVVEWGLPSEPWLFVVDGDGVVSARFEGVITVGELQDAVA